MSNSLKGKVILITGASSGFGADAARLFARQGCIVVLAARRMDRLQALVEEIRSQGGEALAIPVDVGECAEVELMVKTVGEVYGQIDILFNNAGFGRLDWLENLNPDRDISTQIEVNLQGLVQVTRAVLPAMLARRSGHIINMASVAGLIAAPLYTVYSATKYGVRGFTDALRREVGPFGIKVSGIYPGPAATEFGQHTGNSAAKASLNLPKWLSMDSAYVARKTVGLARHPRRSLIIPWYYQVIVGFDTLFPALVDWFLKVAFVRQHHRLSRNEK